MGGAFWLPGAALNPANRATVQVANWGVAVLLGIGALVVFAMTRGVGRIHPALLLTPI